MSDLGGVRWPLCAVEHPGPHTTGASPPCALGPTLPHAGILLPGALECSCLWALGQRFPIWAPPVQHSMSCGGDEQPSQSGWGNGQAG